MTRLAASLRPIRQSSETDLSTAKQSIAGKASPPFTPQPIYAGVDEATLGLRRAFRTPPPLMGGGWQGKRGQS